MDTSSSAKPSPDKTSADLYLDLLARVLTRSAFLDQEVRDARPTNWVRHIEGAVRKKGYRIVRPFSSGEIREQEEGRVWPDTAETMVGLERLQNVRRCVETVLEDGVPGDLVETGVWRGGASIYMRAVLATRSIRDRRVWLADSFRGLPPPDAGKYPADEGLDLSIFPELSVSLETVKANFDRYGLLDDQVEFLVGWFRDTLPNAPIERVAVLRLDGDLYESTWDALAALYPKLSVGGYVIVDDFGAIKACKEAIHDFRAAEGITEGIELIDWTGAFWRRLR
jgi:O-methyltransferase